MSITSILLLLIIIIKMCCYCSHSRQQFNIITHPARSPSTPYFSRHDYRFLLYSSTICHKVFELFPSLEAQVLLMKFYLSTDFLSAAPRHILCILFAFAFVLFEVGKYFSRTILCVCVCERS